MKYEYKLLLGGAIVSVYSFVLGAVLTAVFWSGSIDDAQFGALEFWVNRYQTLLTGILALAGVYAVWRQIVESRIQTKRQLKLSYHGTLQSFVYLATALKGLKESLENFRDGKSDNPLGLMLDITHNLSQDAPVSVRGSLLVLRKMIESYTNDRENKSIYSVRFETVISHLNTTNQLLDIESNAISKIING